MTKTDADGMVIGVDAATLTPSVADGLISVFAAEIGGTLRPAVDARELHQFLVSKQDFSSWVKRRFREYGFVEGDDYVSITKFSDGYKRDKNNRVIDDKGLIVPIEYHFKLDVAKEMVMVEKNAKAAARRYFIGCESRLLAQLLAQAGQTEPEAPPSSDAGEVFPLPEDRVPILLAVHERSLFLFCREYVPFLSDPALSVAELRLRWQCLRAYFYGLGDGMFDGVEAVAAQTPGGADEKRRAAFAFIWRWRPRGGAGFGDGVGG
ncbi:antA/AntB antirepressor family protein [Methylovulum psychrotolerans]|nr:antA/AntB antirepressor family protein [Methylovulum psychrotolerans]